MSSFFLTPSLKSLITAGSAGWGQLNYTTSAMDNFQVVFSATRSHLLIFVCFSHRDCDRFEFGYEIVVFRHILQATFECVCLYIHMNTHTHTQSILTLKSQFWISNKVASNGDVFVLFNRKYVQIFFYFFILNLLIKTSQISFGKYFSYFWFKVNAVWFDVLIWLSKNIVRPLYVISKSVYFTRNSLFNKLRHTCTQAQ